MKVTKEVTLDKFEAWSGAVDTKNALSDKQLQWLETMLEELYPDGMTATELNDFLWFGTDTIAQWLGFSSWDVLTGEDEDE